VGTDVPEVRPGDVAFRLSWRAEPGHLTGELEASNVCDHAVRLSGKPGLTQIGLDGEPLAAETIVTLEFRPPGLVELARRVSEYGHGWDGAAGTARPPAAPSWSRGRGARPRSRHMVLANPRRMGQPRICGVLGLSASDDPAELSRLSAWLCVHRATYTHGSYDPLQLGRYCAACPRCPRRPARRRPPNSRPAAYVRRAVAGAVRALRPLDSRQRRMCRKTPARRGGMGGTGYGRAAQHQSARVPAAQDRQQLYGHPGSPRREPLRQYPPSSHDT
jgi:hypothetical protein